jgi:hypothetical protein
LLSQHTVTTSDRIPSGIDTAMLSQQPVLELRKQCYEQVDVTREQLASMDWEMVLQRIRER